MCVCVCVCICMFVCVCICVSTFLCVYVSVSVCVYVSVCEGRYSKSWRCRGNDNVIAMYPFLKVFCTESEWSGG